MTVQNSIAVRNAQGDAWETAMGTSTKWRIYSGAQPANCAAAASGTLGAEFSLASDWSAAAASGAKSLSSLPLSTTGLAPITAGHYRVYDSAGSTCHEQGTCFATVNLSTNALTAANSNVLNFASTTGVVVGMNASGTGVVPGSTVLAVTGTTVTLSLASTAGVANAAAITFGGDLSIDNANIAAGQTVQITAFTKTWPGA